MELQYRELENGIRLIKLIGRLDINGIGAMESKFVAHCAGSQVKVMIDLSEMDFLSSVGGYLFLWTAKEVLRNGGKFVLLNPSPNVEQILQLTGAKELIPILSDLDTATSSLLAIN